MAGDRHSETHELFLEQKDPLSFDASEYISYKPTDIGHYTGPYMVTPGNQPQVLLTRDLLMQDNVIIQKVPSNYGLVLWDGSTMTIR